MDEDEKCLECNSNITSAMIYCPYCGIQISRNSRYSYNVDKNLKCLDDIENSLTQLEEELELILCKKR